MTDKELSQNLLMAHMCIKAANECLKTIYEFKGRVNNKEFIQVIKEVKPKLSYFNKIIDSTLLNSAYINPKHLEEMNENCMVILDSLDEEIKKYT
jgi:predicted RNA-binding protein with EMAP domain